MFSRILNLRICFTIFVLVKDSRLSFVERKGYIAIFCLF